MRRVAARSRVAAMRGVAVRGKFGLDAVQQVLHSFFQFGRALCLSVPGRMVLVYVGKETGKAIRGFVIMNGFVGGGGIAIAGTNKEGGLLDSIMLSTNGKVQLLTASITACVMKKKKKKKRFGGRSYLLFPSRSWERRIGVI